MAATPEQQQMVAQKLAESPDWASAPPELKNQLVSLFTSGAQPQEIAQALGQLHQQYPQFVTQQSIWKNPAFIAGLAALTAGVGSALIGGGAAVAGGATDAVGLGPVAATGGTTAATVPAALASGSSGVLGALGKYGGIAGDIGKIASSTATGLASGRREDAAANGRAIAENNQAKTQAAQFNLKLPEARTNQVARGEVLNTMQNAPLTGDARIDKFSGGGLRPSAFGPESRQAGAELSRQALGHLMDPAGDRLTPQEIPGTSASTPENIAAGIGIGGDIFSLLAKYGGR